MESSANIIDLSQLRRSCGCCVLNGMCLPAGIHRDDLDRLDSAVRSMRTLEQGRALYRDDDDFQSLYIVRSGSLKSFVLNAAGAVQILGFHLPGEIVGLDALAADRHVSHAEALEPTNICELPYARLQQVTLEVPALHRQLMRMISREIIAEHRHTVMMGRPQAQERLALLLKDLTDRYQRLQRNSSTLSLPMSRYDIANYLGVVVETVSRLFSRMKEMGVLEVDRKSVRILRPDLLADLCQSSSVSSARRRGAG